jgi:hypothetical protein
MLDPQIQPDPPIQITSDWGKVFGIVWHNQRALDPRGMIGYMDFSSNKIWILFPSSRFPFARVSYWRFQPEAQ